MEEEGCDDRKETIDGRCENISMRWIFCIVRRNGFTRIDLWELENTMLGKKSCTRCGGEWMKYEMRENSDHQADLNIYVYAYCICRRARARAHTHLRSHDTFFRLKSFPFMYFPDADIVPLSSLFTLSVSVLPAAAPSPLFGECPRNPRSKTKIDAILCSR